MATSLSPSQPSAPGGPASGPSASSGPSSGGSASSGSDWTVQVADTIESVVSSVRQKTTVPLETVARALVYGVLIAVMGTMAAVLAIIILVRLGSYLMPVWGVYAILGGIFTALGLFLWRKRRPEGESAGKRS